MEPPGAPCAARSTGVRWPMTHVRPRSSGKCWYSRSNICAFARSAPSSQARAARSAASGPTGSGGAFTMTNSPVRPGGAIVGSVADGLQKYTVGSVASCPPNSSSNSRR